MGALLTRPRIFSALYENDRSDPAQFMHLKESINSVMAGPGRGGSSSGGNHQPQSNGSSTAGYGRAGTYSNHVSHSSHIQPPVFNQNGFGFGTTPGQSRGGYGGGASAPVPQRPGMVHFRQSPLAQGLTSRPGLQFKPSPFYKVVDLIGTVRSLDGMCTLPFAQVTQVCLVVPKCRGRRQLLSVTLPHCYDSVLEQVQNVVRLKLQANQVASLDSRSVASVGVRLLRNLYDRIDGLTFHLHSDGAAPSLDQYHAQDKRYAGPGTLLPRQEPSCPSVLRWR